MQNLDEITHPRLVDMPTCQSVKAMFSKVQKEPWIGDEVLDRHPSNDRDDQAGNPTYGDMRSIGIRSMTPLALQDHPDEQPCEEEALQLSEQELLG